MEKSFEHMGFGKRFKTMMKTDLRRMFTMPHIYIIVCSCFIMPVLILVMTTFYAK